MSKLIIRYGEPLNGYTEYQIINVETDKVLFRSSAPSFFVRDIANGKLKLEEEELAGKDKA